MSFLKSINFVFKNLLWILPLGFVVSLPGLFKDVWMSKPSGQYGALLNALVLGAVNLVVYPLFAGTVVIALGEHYLGRKIAWYQALCRCVKKWIFLIFLEFEVSFVIGIGTLALIVPGIIAFCATACAIPAMMLEDLGPFKAFSRSWLLTRGNRCRIFGYSLLCGLIGLVPMGILALVMHKVPLVALHKEGLSSLILAPFMALWPAITTLLFIDLRTREEAFDWEGRATRS